MSICSGCGTDNDAWRGVGTTDPGRPEDGAVSLCLYCGTIAIFTDTDGNTREPSRDELAELLADRVIRVTVMAIRMRNATQGMPTPSHRPHHSHGEQEAG